MATLVKITPSRAPVSKEISCKRGFLRSYATLRSTWEHSGGTWGSFWDHFGYIRVAWGHLWVTLGVTRWSLLVFEGGFGDTLESLWEHLRHMEVTLGLFWCQFGVSLGICG